MNLRIFASAAAAVLACAPCAGAQSAVLLDLDSGSPSSDRFRVDSSGAFVAYGLVRDVSSGTGCAAQLPAAGAGTRFVWHPCRGAVRWGRVPAGQTDWDDASIQDFSFAGGSDVVASGINSFAFGDAINVTAQAATGFGSGVTVSGTAGFSAGASNTCSGFACTAIGYTVRAGGQGSVALGYRTTANNNYAVALGYRASNNTHTGTMVMGDESTTDSVRNQADNEFRIRYNGGIRLRVSTAANGNTPGAGGNVGCDLTVAVPSWTCASSRTLKENYQPVNGEDVLIRLRSVPVTTWTMIGADENVLHLGPVAEDFYQAFALGLGPTAIGMGDIDGVNLAAAKALEVRTTDLQAQLNARTTQVHALQAQVDAQASLIAQMEARLRALEARP
jgi:trimeric autotransporter adhesin